MAVRQNVDGSFRFSSGWSADSGGGCACSSDDHLSTHRPRFRFLHPCWRAHEWVCSGDIIGRASRHYRKANGSPTSTGRRIPVPEFRGPRDSGPGGHLLNRISAAGGLEKPIHACTRMWAISWSFRASSFASRVRLASSPWQTTFEAKMNVRYAKKPWLTLERSVSSIMGQHPWHPRKTSVLVCMLPRLTA